MTSNLVFLGFTILVLSKMEMYEIYVSLCLYLKKYGDRARLCKLDGEIIRKKSFV